MSGKVSGKDKVNNLKVGERMLTVKISRFNPAEQSAPKIKEYTVKVHEGARVLDVLKAVRDTLDPTLLFRHCCGAGQCGSCALKVNGQPRLACITEAEDDMLLEPLDLPVIRDLVTDIGRYLKEMPYLVHADNREECAAAGKGSDAPSSPSCSACSTCSFSMPSKEETAEMKPLRDCIECLCCVSVCPALKVTDFAGPTYMRQQMRLALDPRDCDKDRIKGIADKGLFNCTTCQACVLACPKNIKIPGKAIEKLRILANREGLTLPRHKEVAEFVKTTGRSVQPLPDRKSLLETIDEVIEPYGDVKDEVGFFTGCLYDLRMQSTALDAIEVLRRNGIRIITPKEQVCCGSPLIRTGQTAIVRDLMKKNIDCFVKRGIKKVMTICAGCGSTLKNDYDAPFEVVDINEILTGIEIEKPEKTGHKIAYHDPCHLLRGQGIREQPRKLLRLITDDLVEIPSECCGSGGGVKSGNPAEAEAIGKLRGEEIKKSGCDIVATSCPFCEIHVQSVTDKPVKNINTLLMEGYRKKDSMNADGATDAKDAKSASENASKEQ